MSCRPQLPFQMHHACDSGFGTGGRWGKVEENKAKISSVGKQFSHLVSLQLPNIPSINKAREDCSLCTRYAGSFMLRAEGK